MEVDGINLLEAGSAYRPSNDLNLTDDSASSYKINWKNYMGWAELNENYMPAGNDPDSVDEKLSYLKEMVGDSFDDEHNQRKIAWYKDIARFLVDYKNALVDIYQGNRRWMNVLKVGVTTIAGAGLVAAMIFVPTIVPFLVSIIKDSEISAALATGGVFAASAAIAAWGMSQVFNGIKKLFKTKLFKNRFTKEKYQVPNKVTRKWKEKFNIDGNTVKLMNGYILNRIKAVEKNKALHIALSGLYEKGFDDIDCRAAAKLVHFFENERNLLAGLILKAKDSKEKEALLKEQKSVDKIWEGLQSFEVNKKLKNPKLFSHVAETEVLKRLSSDVNPILPEHKSPDKTSDVLETEKEQSISKKLAKRSKALKEELKNAAKSEMGDYAQSAHTPLVFDSATTSLYKISEKKYGYVARQSTQDNETQLSVKPSPSIGKIKEMKYVQLESEGGQIKLPAMLKVKSSLKDKQEKHTSFLVESSAVKSDEEKLDQTFLQMAYQAKQYADKRNIKKLDIVSGGDIEVAAKLYISAKFAHLDPVLTEFSKEERHQVRKKAREYLQDLKKNRKEKAKKQPTHRERR